MTKLLDPRKIIKITLPSFPDSEVEIYDGLLTGEALGLNKEEADNETGMLLLQKIIKSWSFVDENEKPLAITKETLGLLPMKDFKMLMDKVNKTMGFLVEKETKI